MHNSVRNEWRPLAGSMAPPKWNAWRPLMGCMAPQGGHLTGNNLQEVKLHVLQHSADMAAHAGEIAVHQTHRLARHAVMWTSAKDIHVPFHMEREICDFNHAQQINKPSAVAKPGGPE